MKKSTFSNGPKASVQHVNGEATIVVDGKPFPPMTITLTPFKDLSSLGGIGTGAGHSFEKPLLPDTPEMEKYLKGLSQAGMRIFFIEESTSWRKPGNERQPSGVEQTLKDMEQILRYIPEAYLIVRINISPTKEWVNAHPEEQVTYSDGSHRPLKCSTVSSEVLDGMHSLCSKAWIRDAEPHIEEFLEEIEKSPVFERVIGFMLCAGGTYEWYYPDCPLALVKADGTYADFSEPFMEEYRLLLKEKYKDENELKRVWNRPDASFDHPIIPLPEEREHCYKADQKIVSHLLNWHENNAAKSINPTKSNLDSRSETTNGVFLNMNRCAYTADFFQAWHRGTANTIIAFAKMFKERYPDLLVGSFYSSMACTSFYGSGNNSEIYPFFNTPWVDFLASPSCYDNREPGNVPAQRGIHDSFAIRDKLYMNEDDSRVAGAYPWMLSETMGLFNEQDTLSTLKRAFGHNLAEGLYSWWYDMHTGWYKQESVLALFKRQQQVALAACRVDRTKKNEIALIFDTESLHCVSHYTSIQILDFFRCTEIPRLGIPTDFYYHDDMADERMPDYKMYIMMNCFYLTQSEREAIFAKARRNNAVVVWLYAPGYMDPGAENVMDAGNIEKTVGMKVREYDYTRFPHFQVDTAHPATEKASPARRYGGIDRPIRSSVWIQKDQVQPWYVNPSFVITDPEAEVLARYCDNGEPIMALSEKNGFRSVYCAAQVMRSDLLASIAEWAGCHRFIDTEDILFANENFVTLHAAHDGTVNIHFKKECSPYEVYAGRYDSRNVLDMEIAVHIGDTYTWCVNDELSVILDQEKDPDRS